MRGCGKRYKIGSVGHQIECEHELICGEGNGLCPRCRIKLTKSELGEIRKLKSYYSSLDLDVGSDKSAPNSERNILNALSKLLLMYEKLRIGDIK